MEKTFAIIKPDACNRNIVGQALERIEENCFHSSDALQTAAYEIAYFFSTLELCTWNARSRTIQKEN